MWLHLRNPEVSITVDEDPGWAEEDVLMGAESETGNTS